MFVVALVLIFAALILIHELGHFLAAKRAGVRVEEFGIGFPPRLLGFKRGETTYSLNLIPLGGFVRIYGEDGDSKDDTASYAARPLRIRAGIIAAGVFMNLLLAVFVLSVVNATAQPRWSLEPLPEEKGAVLVKPFAITVIDVEENSPAALAGIQVNDELVAGNGTAFRSVEEVTAFTRAHAGEKVALTTRRGGTETAKEIRLRHPEEKKGALGIQPIGITVVRYPFYLAPLMALRDVGVLIVSIVAGLGALIAGIFSGANVSESVSSPVGIGFMLYRLTKLGASYVLAFAGALSVNLAVLNIMPFPALDGGKLLFLALEKIRGRRVLPKIENAIHLAGFVALLLLIAVALYADLEKFAIFKR